MLNILSYLGVSLSNEVCLWTLLGILTTVFDATLFKVNANLKQVWQMRMPEELSRPLQRTVRAIISGLMLMQGFTVYVYLAAYVVLLYPVFLEERPTLVLPWLLLAAVRKLLCELTSLALGLGICVLLGASRPPCIKFVVTKLVSITPAFYMWLLVLDYYHTLKVASTFKTFRTMTLSSSEHDYGLELAVRRRRTKSLQGEDQLRRGLLQLYSERHLTSSKDNTLLRPKSNQIRASISSRLLHHNGETGEQSSDNSGFSQTDFQHPIEVVQSFVYTPRPTVEEIDDGITIDVVVPRDTDRILEQFVLMMLKIGAYKKKTGNEEAETPVITSTSRNIPCESLTDHSETPSPMVGSSNRISTASYITDYPQIFMKKPPDNKLRDFSFTTNNELLSLSTTTQASTECHSKSHDEIEKRVPNGCCKPLEIIQSSSADTGDRYNLHDNDRTDTQSSDVTAIQDLSSDNTNSQRSIQEIEQSTKVLEERTSKKLSGE